MDILVCTGLAELLREFFVQSPVKFCCDKTFGEILLILFAQEMWLQRARDLSQDNFRDKLCECKVRISRNFRSAGVLPLRYSVENTSDHPHPSKFAKNMPQEYATQWGSVWHKVP